MVEHSVASRGSHARGRLDLRAAAFVAVACGGLVAAVGWDLVAWTVGLLPILIGAAMLPLSRVRGPLDGEDGPEPRRWWVPGTWVFWVPLSILLPAQPVWLGLGAGIAAAVHAFFALIEFWRV